MIPIAPSAIAGEADSVGEQAYDAVHLMRPGVLHLTSLPPLSLYVHLPWCIQKCPYCDFNSHAAPQGALPEENYIDALVRDLEAALPLVWGRPVHSIFIGGGTPSLFTPQSIDQLLGAIRATCAWCPIAKSPWKQIRVRLRKTASALLRRPASRVCRWACKALTTST
jgi:oxygen-independent coproporphyrinogen-3 oxidase